MSLLLRHLEAHGPLTRADLEAALRRQQQAGGSLDTAILELGLLPPLALDACLQAACGLPGAPVRLLERGPARPWEHVPKDLVDIGWAMPLAAEDGRLIVAVHPDLPDAKLGQLYRHVRGFYPVVAPECCLAKIAAERTGAILAPRYALILLDYLEALRGAAVTVEYDGQAPDVPVSTDRQVAGPRPAATMTGPTASAVGDDLSARRPDAPADASAPRDRDTPAAAQPVPEDSDARRPDAPASATRDHQTARPGDSDAPVPADSDAPPATRPFPAATYPGGPDAPVPSASGAPPATRPFPAGHYPGAPDAPAPADSVAPPAARPGLADRLYDAPEAPHEPGSLHATWDRDPSDPAPTPSDTALTEASAESPAASEPGFGPFGTTLVPGSLRATGDTVTAVASDHGLGPISTTLVPGSLAAGEGSPTPVASDRGFRLAAGSPAAGAARLPDDASQHLAGDSSAAPADAAPTPPTPAGAAPSDAPDSLAAPAPSDTSSTPPSAPATPVPGDTSVAAPVAAGARSAGDPRATDPDAAPVSSDTRSADAPLANAPDAPPVSSDTSSDALAAPVPPDTRDGGAPLATAPDPAPVTSDTSSDPRSTTVASDTSADGLAAPVPPDARGASGPLAAAPGVAPVSSDTSPDALDTRSAGDALAAAPGVAPVSSDTSPDARAAAVAPDKSAEALATPRSASGPLAAAPGVAPVSSDTSRSAEPETGASRSDTPPPPAARHRTSPEAAAVVFEPPPGFTTLAIAPDAPLIATGPIDQAGLDGSTGALAIAPDTPLIILPPTTGVHARASVVTVPLSQRPTPSPATTGDSASGSSTPTERTAEATPSSAPASTAAADPIPGHAERPASASDAPTAATAAADPTPEHAERPASASDAPTAAVSAATDAPDRAGVPDAPAPDTAAPAAASDAPVAPSDSDSVPVPRDSTQRSDATSRPHDVAARSAAAAGDPAAPASSDSQATRLVQPTTRTQPTTPKPMVMTLAQRLDAARVALANAEGRDRITEALVRAVALIAPRVALFGVKREGLRVLAAPGSALRLAEGSVLPLPEGGLLDRAVSGLGPMHLLIEPTLSAAVGQPLGIPCIFEPVLAGGRTVLMVYLDRAGVAFDPRERTVVRELCDVARQSLEALLRLLGWVVPDSQRSGDPNDPSRPVVRPHLAKPVVRVDETEPPATDPPLPVAPSPAEPADSDSSPRAAAADDVSSHEASDRPPPTSSLVERGQAEVSPGDSASASRSRGRGSRGRAVITLTNPIRRDEHPAVTPLPARPESSASLTAAPLAADHEDSGAHAPDDASAPEGERHDGPGLGLAPVPVPLGPDADDGPLAARFAALAAKVDGAPADMSSRSGSEGHASSDNEAQPAQAQVDMPEWIARQEPSGIEDPLPVASALLSTRRASAEEPDPASTLPGAARIRLDEPELDARPRVASDTPTVLDLSPPTAHEAPSLEPSASPDAPTVLDIQPLDPAPTTLIPNLIAPPGTPGAGRRRRPIDEPESEPVLVIPKTLRRSSGLTATPHPMARRERDETGEVPTLSMPPTLISPRSGRRRGKHEPRPEAPTDALTMPRLVRQAPDETERLAPGAQDHAPEDMSEATGTSGHVLSDKPDPADSSAGAAREVADAEDFADGREELAAGPSPSDEAATDDLDEPAASPRAEADERPASASPDSPADEAEPRAAASAVSSTDRPEAPRPAASPEGAAEGGLSDREIDAVIAAFLRDPSEPPGVDRLRALGERGLARLVARFPGPIDLANATNFPPPSAHGPLLRACVELGPPLSPYVFELFASVRPQIRFYAAFLFQELRDPRCLPPLGELAFDPDADVRLIATRVLESYSRTPEFAAVATRIRDELDSRERDRQLLAVEATGTLRDTRAVPRLIDLLAVRDKHIREAALEALCSITAKHHGYRTVRWRAWYEEHGHEPRIEWVLDGLRHRDVAVRRWAADELARITGQRIPFPADGDRRSREQALRAWQAWWDEHREEFSAGP